MPRVLILAIIVVTQISTSSAWGADDPEQTVRQSEQVLGELLAIPGKEIPQRLLAEAQGVAVIPRVIKVGFVAGARRGHGVVLVRDENGEWGLPQFITLTGGSIGWQAGVQGADLVLVFTTRKSVEGLAKGKFTIGADAAATAGPVGRNAAAATDAALKAEILSYSRSRGLFLGVSIDGSALEIDQASHLAFYGVPNTAAPVRVPESAAQLRLFLTGLTQGTPLATVAGAPAAPNPSDARLEGLRQMLIQNSAALQAMLTPEWRQYLAMPAEISAPNGRPTVGALTAAQQRFAQVDGLPAYRQLAGRPEFRVTYDLLREYVAASTASSATPALQLPPPPAR